MSQIATTQPRPAGRTLMLIAGDIIALLAFAAIGRRSHGEAAGLAALVEVATTAAPFIGGWLLAAPLLGAYRASATAGIGPMAQRTALAWLVALPIGGALRALMVGRPSPPSFYVVTFLVVLVMLCGWRTAFAWREGRR
jgi:Protein of unknown function (DUF3054)